MTLGIQLLTAPLFEAELLQGSARSGRASTSNLEVEGMPDLADQNEVSGFPNPAM